MKQLKLLSLLVVFAAFALFFTSCSGNDPEPEGPQLHGTWSASNLAITGTATTKVGGATIAESAFTGSSTSADYQLTIEEKGTYSGSGSITAEVVSQVNGQTITDTRTFSSAETIGSGTWTQAGDVLTFTDANGTVSEAMLVALTDTTLVMEVMLEQEEIDETFGIVTEFKIDATFSFTR